LGFFDSHEQIRWIEKLARAETPHALDMSNYMTSQKDCKISIFRKIERFVMNVSVGKIDTKLGGFDTRTTEYSPGYVNL
jgi:hypothetical protein